jgi:hypothetical protein
VLHEIAHVGRAAAEVNHFPLLARDALERRVAGCFSAVPINQGIVPKHVDSTRMIARVFLVRRRAYTGDIRRRPNVCGQNQAGHHCGRSDQSDTEVFHECLSRVHGWNYLEPCACAGDKAGQSNGPEYTMTVVLPLVMRTFKFDSNGVLVPSASMARVARGPRSAKLSRYVSVLPSEATEPDGSPVSTIGVPAIRCATAFC